jgi:hypothetical protein
MAFCITTLVTYKNGYFLNKIIKFFTNYNISCINSKETINIRRIEYRRQVFSG